MDSKTLNVLEYPKILEKLAGFCDFSASMDLARQLEPTDSYELAIARIAETTEARKLLAVQDVSIGAAHDIRQSADLAARSGVLDAHALLDVKSTLIACRELKKTFEKKENEFPRLCLIAEGLPETHGIVDAISRILSERGEVLDSASVKLADIRRNLRVAHDRLMSRLQKYVTDTRTSSMLQEAIITQRDGRYVIPLRAEFKGRIKAVIHDQSSSGATLFIEPLPIVEANNEIRELQLAERDEEWRILAEVSSVVGAHASELKYGVENLAVLDLAFAKAKYGEELRASEPELRNAESKMQNAEKQSSIKLLQARHPLLDPDMVVPVDVDPREGTRAIVITGPNTGGKTVSLKTVGLLVLMAQSGLHIPAQSGSELPFFKSVYADIGDEQSIEQSLSTFSGHITNIIRILKQIDNRSLVIFDELGSGTDPQEGAAIARAILTHLLEVGVMTLVATHYPELKTFAHSTEGVVNASLEFDIKTLRPTYKLTIGLPGRSNALAIAQKLGLSQSIIESARAEINPLDLRADKLLDDIRKERNRTSREREKLEKQRAKLEAQNLELEKRLEKIEDERRETIAKARAEGELEVALLKRNLDSLKSQLKKASQPLTAIRAIEERMEKLEEKAEAPVERRQTADGIRQSAVSGQLRLGEKVTVSSLNAEGVVTALGESDAEVQIGTIRVRAKMSDLIRRQTADDRPQKEKPKQQPSSTVNRPSSVSPGMEVDLRGLMAEDALDKMERYLEQAYLSGLPWVRIIHGKGTGKLRQAVRETLKGHTYVKSFEEGASNEGGEGVTVAKLNAA
ncbi:MAG: endonuclease MutS2 [Anaerolineales bacterium]|uniref:endonuclease MutS2 n=1 Tax=Candidatus Villigracilis vicinus TaxID=3140679 RepID=UPI00313729E7|nr:endonuclease MutS2 [Anaerolineales bacterium]